MDPATATEQVRVTVVGDGATADIALPTTLPVRELIRPIRRTLTSGRDDDGPQADKDADEDDVALRPYSLAPIGATPFSPDATLATLNVEDGALLLLRRLPPGPAAPPVVENIADAAAIHSAAQFDSFRHEQLAAASQVCVLAVGAVVCGLAVHGWLLGYHVWAAAALAVLTVSFMAAMVVLGRRGATAVVGRAGVATVVPLALTLALALPGDGAAHRVFLAAAGLAAWSLVVQAKTSTWVATHTAVIAVAVPVALAAAARIIWDLPYLPLGCGLIGASLLLAKYAPNGSAVWARFPLPNVPAPGEEVPAPPTLAELEDLPRKTRVSHAYQTGLLVGSVILAVIGSVMVVWLPASPSWMCWLLVVATAVVVLMRTRIWDIAVQALWFIAAPLLTTAALAISFVATGHLMAGVYAAGVLVVLALAVVVAGTVTPRELTLPRRRLLDVAEGALLMLIPPLVFILVGLFDLIRNFGGF